MEKLVKATIRELELEISVQEHKAENAILKENYDQYYLCMGIATGYDEAIRKLK